MKKLIFLFMTTVCLNSLVFGQYYIGNTAQGIIGSLNNNATMISKNYSENHELILSWIEDRYTKFVALFNDQIFYKSYIIPLNEITLAQWFQTINGTLSKASGEKGTWISYTRTGTFQLRLDYYAGSIVKCFEVTKTDQY